MPKLPTLEPIYVARRKRWIVDVAASKSATGKRYKSTFRTRVAATAIAHNDAEFFRQLARCMDRIPTGTVRDYPLRALVLLAYGYCNTPAPSPAEVARQVNAMTDRHLTTSRVVKELVALGLHAAGAKN